MINREQQAIDVNDERFSERAAALFDNSVQTLDGQSRSRLNRARQNALSQTSRKTPRSYWLPAMASVAVAAIAGTMLWSADDLDTDYVPPAVTADFEILLDTDSLELLEDLEFYSWLDETAISGGHVG